jgi:signal transduction histidine kinase
VSPDTLKEILGYVSAAAFTVVGLVSLLQWRHRRDRPAFWAAGCFATIAVVLIASLVLPDDPQNDVDVVLQRLLIVVVLLFPYFLYRFAAAFDPLPVWVDRAVAGATLVLMAWTLVLPDIPAPGESRSGFFESYLVAALAVWTVIALFVAARLWRAGRGQPGVARHRMRMLSFAALAMTSALLIAGSNPEGGSTLELATSVLIVFSALAFMLGVSPPDVVRTLWRRAENEETREAISHLMKATTPEEVTADVLPAMARVVGARAIYFVDDEGMPMGSHGAPLALLDTLDEDDPAVLRVELPEGSLIISMSRYAPFFGDEEIAVLRTLGNLASLALDRSRLFVREREARLALERADEMKSNFIALAAHELRTPVTSVHGVVATLDRLGDKLDPADRADLDEALRSQTERMRSLVEQLLDLSRLEADRVPIRPVPVPVRVELEELVAASAGERADEVEVQISGELEAVVDPTVLERVVSNLLTNALRHGAAPFVVSATRTDRHLRVAVEDRGEGVPQDFVEELFERFSRSETARARGLGSGLGLAIARSYAQAHGGELLYEPASPHGARFEFVVPVGSDGEVTGHGRPRRRPR